MSYVHAVTCLKVVVSFVHVVGATYCLGHLQKPTSVKCQAVVERVTKISKMICDEYVSSIDGQNEVNYL